MSHIFQYLAQIRQNLTGQLAPVSASGRCPA
jgi:hypothetical protein